MKAKLFNRDTLKIKPLSERESDLDITVINPLEEYKNKNITIDSKIYKVAQNILEAKNKKAAVILMIGAHVIRSGVQNCIIDLMKKGYISCIAMNGACMIHDYEFALTGKTTESVARYIKTGEFGMWKETGRLNDIINRAYQEDKEAGMGEALGREIENSNMLYKDISIFAAAWRMGIPATVHVSIGYDIIHQHPNCDGAATGALSYNDFLRFTSVIEDLENGVVMNFGSAIMSPEIYLKALSMARNKALQVGRVLKHFTAFVSDCRELPENYRKEPPRDNPAYYFRPWKTMLVRTVADGGESYYVRGRHFETIPALWLAVNELREKNENC